MTIPEDELLLQLATTVGQMLLHGHHQLACAESCTGGYIGKVITDIPGSSAWFERGFVTYTNQSKIGMLDVPADLINEHGAVSEATAKAMAAGVLRHSPADISLAVTGIAGPGGGSPDKPVGTVWFAWAVRHGELKAELRQFKGDRDAVRRQAVLHALQGVIDRLG